MKNLLLPCLLLGIAAGIHSQDTYAPQFLDWQLASVAPGELAQCCQADRPEFAYDAVAKPIDNDAPVALPARSVAAPVATTYARLDCAVPNPYRPGGLIACSQLPPGEHTFELYDSRGRRVFTRTLTERQPFALPVELAAGSYLLKIRISGRPLLSERLVVLPAAEQRE